MDRTTGAPTIGDRIWLVSMPDDFDPIPEGTTGTVTSLTKWLDEGWIIDVDWDNGRTLGLLSWRDKWAPLLDRNEHIVNMYVLMDLTLQQIADRVGISRQRVQQILVAKGVKRYPPGTRRKPKSLTTVA